MTPLDRLRALHAAYEDEGSGQEELDFAAACGNALPSLLACVDALRELCPDHPALAPLVKEESA